MLKEQTKASGMVTITLTKPNGETKVFKIKNLVVIAGLVHIVERMTAAASAAMSHMALGTGTATPVAGNTSLQTQAGARKAFSSVTPSGASITYAATFAPGEATGALAEAGIFNASTGGTMLCRTTFPVVNKQAADTLQITWEFNVA
jgi:hypothetical protein